MTDRLDVLGHSVQHLRGVAARIDPSDFTSNAYPSEWTIADTFSHLGSGAVIGQRRLEDTLADRESDPSFNTSVWDEWNAKDPLAQVDDCLASDSSLLTALEATTPAQREAFRFTMGPFVFDFDGMVGLRLSEHVLHTWDIEVALNPKATLSNDAANAILDNIQFIVARTAKPTGEAKDLTIRTTTPARDFTLRVHPESVELIEAPFDGEPELEIPAETLVRAIYGRLDRDHAPGQLSDSDVDYLHQVFPGF